MKKIEIGIKIQDKNNDWENISDVNIESDAVTIHLHQFQKFQ